MSVNAGARLTRAQAEGVLYELPTCKQSKTFVEQVRSLRHEPGILLEGLHTASFLELFHNKRAEEAGTASYQETLVGKERHISNLVRGLRLEAKP